MHRSLCVRQAEAPAVTAYVSRATGSCESWGLYRKLSAPSIRHPSFFVGLILRGCSLPWPNYGHVVLARPSPILFYPISSTEVRGQLSTVPQALLVQPRPSMVRSLLWLPLCQQASGSVSSATLCARRLTKTPVSAQRLPAQHPLASPPASPRRAECAAQVRCLVDVQGDRLPSASSGALQAHLEGVVAPQVPEQLRRSFLEAAASGSARSMQNKCMPAAPLHCPGALLLGDSFNMRHPLTGAPSAC